MSSSEFISPKGLHTKSIRNPVKIHVTGVPRSQSTASSSSLLKWSLCQGAMASLLWAILALTHNCILKVLVMSFAVRCCCTQPCRWDQLFSWISFLAVGRVRGWSSEHTAHSGSCIPFMPSLGTQENGCVILFLLQMNYLLLPFWWISRLHSLKSSGIRW